MNVSTTIPQNVQIPRGRLLGLLVGVAALTAAITWALLTLVGDSGTSQARSSVTADTLSLPIPSIAVTRAAVAGERPLSLPIPSVAVTRASAAHEPRTVRSIMGLTPGELAGGGLGGYALPSGRSSETLEEVLASMSPQTRRYTEAVMNMTFEQLAAGAAGHP
jgi:hypothetical protein